MRATTPTRPQTKERHIISLQLHKLRNVTDRLPDALASTVAKRMRQAYRLADPLTAEAELEALARSLDRSHPGAAASLREGLAETPTIGRLGVPATLARTLRSTDERFKARCALSAGWEGVSLLGGRGRPRSKEQGLGAGSPAAQLAP
jgi:hypothetical protein